MITRNDVSVFSKKAILIAFLISAFSIPSQASEETLDASHYAFANYLGSGIYRTSGQSAAVLNIPLEYEFDLDSMDDHKFFFHLPLSFGFFDYSFEQLPSGAFPDHVGTLTVTPGIEHHWLVDDQLTIESYVDIGFGRNYSNDSNISIFSTGVSSVYKIDQQQYRPIWVNRLYYAGYSSSLNDGSESYSVYQTGIDVGLNYQWDWDGIGVEPRVFVGGKWFFDKLKFISPVGEDVLTSYTLEVGATLAFSKPVGWQVFGWDGLKVDRFGLSYQAGGGLKVWRLIFDFPL